MTATSFVTLRSKCTLHFGSNRTTIFTGELVYDVTHRNLMLVHDETEQLSINLDHYGYITEPGYTWVKDWSEHSGLAQQLVDARVAIEHRRVTVGPHQTTAVYLELTR